MTDSVTVINGADQSGQIFPHFGGSVEGYASSDFCTAAGSVGLSSLGSLVSTETDAQCIAVLGVGGGFNPNQLVIGITGTLAQDFFETVSFTDHNGTPHTFNSSNATFNGANTSAAGYTTWLFPSLGDGVTIPIGFMNVSFTFSTPAAPPSITLDTPTVVSATDVILTWTASSGDDSGVYESFAIVRNEEVLFDDIDPDVTEWADPTGLPNTEYTYAILGQYSTPEFSPVASNTETITTGDMTDEFNCPCESVTQYATLAALRKRVLIRLGYPNQATNPPPGMALFVNDALYSAQKEIYKQLTNAGIDTERFFRWTMVPGNRYYALNASEGECTLQLDPLKVTWAGFEDLNQAWYRLIDGIPPEFYTRANINFGWPTHYEIRQCIEISPAPQAPYTLWIKGHFGLAPFAADDDTATIDDEAIFLLALGNCKAHYGQGDAQMTLKQAGNYVGGMVAGQHGTRRYVPRTKIQNPATPPRFLPLGNGQA